MQARGEPIESQGEPFVSGGTPPKPIQRLELLAQVCQASPGIFQQAASDSSAIDVQGVSFTDEQSNIQWHCNSADVPSRQLLSKDIIDDEKRDSDAQEMARRFLEDTKAGDAPMALVGLGTGAFIAFAVARELVSKGIRPLGLWLVNPPLRLPWSCTSEPCILKDCPVHVLVDRDSTYGPPWRYEVSTCGPFTTRLFEDLEEMVKIVLSDVLSL